MAVSFVVLPVSVRYLGNEGYGLMATITSVVGWLQFTNLGIGLGLQNALTEETARGDAKAQRELVSTAVLSLVGIGLVLLAAGLLAFPHIPWAAVFRPTTSRFTTEIPWTVLVVFFGFVSTVVLGFVNPIYAARQELHIGSLQAMVTSVLMLLGTFMAVHFRWGLLGITLCTIGVTAVMQWTFALWTLYGRGIEELRPRWSNVTRSAGARVYSTGISFLILQICNIAFFQIDAFLITRFLTVDQVTPYSVAQRVFLQMAGLFAIVTGSLWAAYGNAKAHGDFAWIQRTHMKMVRIYFAFFGGLSFFMIIGGKWAMTLWVGAAAAPSVSLIAAVAFYFCVKEWVALNAMLLNGLNVIREQLIPMVIAAFASLALELYLIKRLGTIGLAIGGGLGVLLGGGWYLIYLTNRTLKRMHVAMSCSGKD